MKETQHVAINYLQIYSIRRYGAKDLSRPKLLTCWKDIANMSRSAVHQ